MPSAARARCVAWLVARKARVHQEEVLDETDESTLIARRADCHRLLAGGGVRACGGGRDSDDRRSGGDFDDRTSGNGDDGCGFGQEPSDPRSDLAGTEPGRSARLNVPPPAQHLPVRLQPVGSGDGHDHFGPGSRQRYVA